MRLLGIEENFTSGLQYSIFVFYLRSLLQRVLCLLQFSVEKLQISRACFQNFASLDILCCSLNYIISICNHMNSDAVWYKKTLRSFERFTHAYLHQIVLEVMLLLRP